MTDLHDALRTVDQWYLNRDGFPVYVCEAGSGRPVIIVHGGFGVDHSSLVDPLLHLAASRRVIWYDQRGSIRSPYATAEQKDSITFDAHVEDLLALSREVGGADVIAHSMGTVTTMAAALREPEALGRIILLAPLRLRDDDVDPEAEEWKRRRAQQAADLVAALDLDREGATAQEQQLAWRIRFTMVNCASDDAWLHERWPGRSWYREDVADLSQRGLDLPVDTIERLAAHRHPVSVIIGDEDAIVDFGAKAWSQHAEENPRINLRVIEGAGHSIWIDRPEEFRAQLGAAFRA